MRTMNDMEIRYYPVIDCDSEGKVKVPIVPTLKEKDVRSNHKLWLREIVSNVFRLCSADEGLKRTNDSFTINCPLCGEELYRIAEGTSNNNHGLYVCRSCKR